MNTNFALGGRKCSYPYPYLGGLLCASLVLLAVDLLNAAELPHPGSTVVPKIFGPSDEAANALKTFRPADGLKVDLFAAEPLVVNPVSFCFDPLGRIYVVETFRRAAGILNIETRVEWEDPAISQLLGPEIVAEYLLAGDLACKTVEENIAFLKRHFGPRAATLSGLSERVRLITPGPDGKALTSSVFAQGFDRIGDGVAAGVLTRGGKVYFGCIPDLWELEDPKGTGVATKKRSLQHGYGVHVGTGSHSLHGLRLGPDGRLYFSMGDRGASVLGWDGSEVDNSESGAVFRCDLDGSHLELFAAGLRNPQGLAFDQFGNLFTGDNNSDGGDPSRWVYLVEGGDSGWRAGYQYIERPNDAETLTHPPKSRGAWLNEGQCFPFFEGQAAFLVPPVANIASGPSGVVFYPGVGLPAKYQDHFFLTDFKGSAANSLIHSFSVIPKGAGFDLVDRAVLISNILPTDVGFGPDCRIYFSDWVNGWPPPGKGRLYRIFDENLVQSSLALETRALIAEGMDHRSVNDLVTLLSHPDQRVRQEAQFALADAEAISALVKVSAESKSQLARLHGIWALGQIAKARASRPNDHTGAPLEALLPLLTDNDPEVAVQAARIFGESRFRAAVPPLMTLATNQTNPRGQYFATLALGKVGTKETLTAILQMLRSNADHDPYLRHAGVMALVWMKDLPAIFAAAQDASSAIRMAALLALRKLNRFEISQFLGDPEPRIVVEAASAISDASIYSALPDLAEMLKQTNRWKAFPNGSQGGPNFLTPFLRRVINAHFRLGAMQNAQELAWLAAQDTAPEEIRFEALQQLGQWEKPRPLDQITGLYRPLPSRDARAAASAIRPFLSVIMQAEFPSVRIAGAKLAGRYQISEAAADLLRIVRDQGGPGRLRVECLKALANLPGTPEFTEALQLAESDPDKNLRIEATRINARLHTSDLPQKLIQASENGTVTEQQNALLTIATLKNQSADALLAAQLDRLLTGTLKPELQLDLLEAVEKRDSLLVKEKVTQYESSLSKGDDLASYRVALFGGDAREGERIFLERPEAACLRCHKVGSEGNEVGPSLKGVGARLSREKLLESIVYPNKQIATGFETTIVRLKNNEAQAGIVRSEDANQLVLNSPETGLVTIHKTEIQSRERGLSGMPEGLGSLLSKRDLRDLVEFLANQ